jgi:hypothetical protein
MLCRTCWDETWVGTRCKTCGTPLFRQKSARLRQAEAREVYVKRCMAWGFGLALLVALAWCHTLPKLAFWFSAFSGIVLAFYLTTVGALGAYEESYEEFWETYGPGIRYILGTGGQVLAALISRRGVTEFLVIECAVLLWSVPLYAALGEWYSCTWTLTMYAAAVVGWFCSSFVRREYY